MNRTLAIRILKLLYELMAVIFFISVIFSYRVFVSSSLIGMIVLSIPYYRLDQGNWWNKSFLNFFTVGCFLYFLIQGIALLYTHNMKAGMFIQQIDLGLIGIPVGVFYSNMVNRKSYGKMMKWYSAILFIACLVALIHALQYYIQNGSTNYFFYHPLVSIYSNHAIQFSILVFVGILFLIEEYSRLEYIKSRKWIIFLLIFFSVFLFLLTSKLIIAIYFLYILYLVTFTNKFFRNRSYRVVSFSALIVSLVLFLFTNSPLRKRLSEEVGNNISFIEQNEFSPADYFNGIEFRLASWRFAYEILNENHSWLLGVSPGDAQDLLNDKYRKLNMFTGGLPDNRKGYLDYHTHNQFLQALLETGIPGLTAFIMICAGLIKLAAKSRDRPMIVLTILLLCYCFADAVLKTQYGIVLFVFFPLFIYKGSQPEVQAS